MVKSSPAGVNMPTITVSYRDLCELLGKPVKLEVLRERLPMFGIEVGGVVGDEMKLEVAHNRPDLLSPEGVARALKGFLGIRTGLPKYKLRKSDVVVEVDPSTEVVRPYIATGIVEGIRLTDTSIAALMQIQDKLDETMGRKRRKTSIGVYDLDKLKPPIRYTTTTPEGVKFVPLDFDRELTPVQILREHPKGIDYGHLLEDLERYPLLVDSEGTVLSMPPIINSEATRVTESTQRLFVDVTGLDKRVTNQELTILMTSLAERGFGLRSVLIRYPNYRVRTPDLKVTRKQLSVKTANESIGVSLKSPKIAGIMKRMRFGVGKIKRDFLTIFIPPYRTDVMHEVDLIEDLAIGYGYNKLEPTLPKIVTTGERYPIEALSDKARRVMTGLGFMEVMTFTLTNPRTNFELMRASGEAATIANPISEEYTIVRTWLLPCLLSVLRANRRHPLPQRIFEVGDVVLLDTEAETGARNVRRVAAAVIGTQANLTYLKALAEALLRELGIVCQIKALDHPSFIEGRAAEFLFKGKRLGVVGELHPEVILGFELEHPVAAFELELPR
jgi:phenylalanyl-tRNA synthetase beta chain